MGPARIVGQQVVGQGRSVFQPNASRAEIPLNAIEQGALGGIMQIYVEFIRKDEFDLSQGIVFARFLAKP